MSDPANLAHLIDDTATAPAADLLAVLTATVLAVPGVIRLEPTLSTSGPGLLLHRGPSDGIQLLTRPGSAAVDVNVATAADHQARAVAHHIQAAVDAAAAAFGYPHTSVAVSVLAVESAASTP